MLSHPLHSKGRLKRFYACPDLSTNSVQISRQLSITCFGLFNPFQIIEVNQDNVQKLFSGWGEEEPNKHSLYKDLLLLSRK